MAYNTIPEDQPLLEEPKQRKFAAKTVAVLCLASAAIAAAATLARRPSGRKFAELANHENCKYVEDQPVCNDAGNVYIKKSDYDASQGSGDIWTKSEKPMYRRLSDYCSHEDPEDPASELEGCVWAPYPLYTYQARCMQVKHATMTCD